MEESKNDLEKLKERFLEEHLLELKCDIKELREENRTEHRGIMSRQDHTNGDVSALKKWQSEVSGFLKGTSKSIGIVWVIIVFIVSLIGSPLINYFIQRSNEERVIREIIDKNDILSLINEAIEKNNNKYFEESK